MPDFDFYGGDFDMVDNVMSSNDCRELEYFEDHYDFRLNVFNLLLTFQVNCVNLMTHAKPGHGLRQLRPMGHRP